MASSSTQKIDQEKESSKYFDIFQYGKQIRRINKKILSIPEKLILWELSDHFGNNGKIFPSNKAISEATELPPKTVLNCLSDLKSKKFINYPKQHNKNKRFISLYDPDVAVTNYVAKSDEYGLLLCPRLSLVRDTAIPGQGVPLIEKNNRKVHPTPKPPSDPPPSDSKKSTPDLVLVGSAFEALKNRVCERLRPDFNLRTYRDLKAKKLTDGQIKAAIDAMNAANVESCGWLMWHVKSRGVENIVDLDVVAQKIEQTKQNNTEDEKNRKAEKEKDAQQRNDGINEIEALNLSENEKADLIRAFAMTKPVQMIKKWAKKSWDEVVGNMKFQDFVKERLNAKHGR